MISWKAHSQLVCLIALEYKPVLSYLCVLGCCVLVYISKERHVDLAKIDLRAEEGILVGYKDNHIFQCFILSYSLGLQVVCTLHLQFFKENFSETTSSVLTNEAVILRFFIVDNTSDKVNPCFSLVNLLAVWDIKCGVNCMALIQLTGLCIPPSLLSHNCSE